MLEAAGLDPTYLIGGDLNESGSGARHGAGDLFVFEADESDGSFLLVPPWAGVVTNIDVDHLDFYPGGLAEIEAAFAAVRGRCCHGGRLRRRPACPRRRRSGAPAAVRLRTGRPRTPTCGCTSTSSGPTGARGRLAVDGDEVALTLRVDGAHNLAERRGRDRRRPRSPASPRPRRRGDWPGSKGSTGASSCAARRGGAEFFDDYGHNPTEMAVTVATARRRAPRPADRARAAAPVLARPGAVARARRERGRRRPRRRHGCLRGRAGADPRGDRAARRRRRARRRPATCRPCTCRTEATSSTFLAARSRPGDLVVTMGCGDVWMLGDADPRTASRSRRGMSAGLPRRARSSRDARAATGCGRGSRWRRSRRSGSAVPRRCSWRPEDEPISTPCGRAVGATGIAVVVIGKGSNVLVADAGFPGLVLRLGRGFRWSGARRRRPARRRRDAAARRSRGSRSATGSSGLAFAVAIPASLGGAVSG